MPTFKDWPRVEQPDPGSALWRYLTAAKFEDLLATATLYFCRVDRFDDAFEGSIGQAGASHKNKLLKEFALASDLIDDLVEKPGRTVVAVPHGYTAWQIA